MVGFEFSKETGWESLEWKARMRWTLNKWGLGWEVMWTYRTWYLPGTVNCALWIAVLVVIVALLPSWLYMLRYGSNQ